RAARRARAAPREHVALRVGQVPALHEVVGLDARYLVLEALVTGDELRVRGAARPPEARRVEDLRLAHRVRSVFGHHGPAILERDGFRAGPDARRHGEQAETTANGCLHDPSTGVSGTRDIRAPR